MRPFVRVGLSFVIMLAAYGAYAVTAVPLIEPARSAVAETPPLPPSTAPAPEVDPNDRMYRWFGPDRHAWELQKPKMLRNDQGILLFQNYATDPKNLGAKKVRLTKVSMVFLNRNGPEGSERDRQAVILQAPTGAVLEFDRPFNVLRGDVGQLVGGTLTGEVVIRSEGRSPGPEDDLRIVTHDVKLTKTAILTSHPVHFEYGPNDGKGTGLKIELLPEDEHHGSAWGRIQSFTLERNVRLNLVVKERAVRGATMAAQPPPSPAPSGHGATETHGTTDQAAFAPERPMLLHNGAPVEVVCQGSFRFDALKDEASFEHQVVVTKKPIHAAAEEPDTLTCHRLELHLAPPEEAKKKAAHKVAADAAKEGKSTPEPKATAATDKAAPVPARKIEVRRVVAIGIPAIALGISQAVPVELRVPSSRAFAKGDCLTYDLETRSVRLETRAKEPGGSPSRDDARQVTFQHEGNEIRARSLVYHPGEDGRLGRFDAEGAGEIDWQIRDLRELQAAGSNMPLAAGRTGNLGEQRRFRARWTRKLQSLPSDGRQVISLLGGAQALVTDMGRLDADEIHAWMYEVPRATAAGATAQKTKYDLIPDRMMARASAEVPVVIDAPQLTGRTQSLEIFIQHAPETGSRVGAPGAGAASGLEPIANGTRGASPFAFPARPAPGGEGGLRVNGDGAPQAQSSQRFDVTGKRMQVQLQRVGRDTQWRQVDIFEQARLLETRTSKPGELPFEVTGDFVHATQPDDQGGEITVMANDGRAARINGRGMSLTGLPRRTTQPNGPTATVSAINLDQRRNRAWIDGPGAMTLIADRDLQGEKLSQPTPIEFDWAKSMNFDGQRAIFEGSIRVTQQSASLQTEQLEAVLSQRIDLSRPKQDGGQRPQVDRVICRGGLVIQRTTQDARGAVAREQLQAKDLTIDQVSGAIIANGPGWITRVYRRDSELDPARTGPRDVVAKAAPLGQAAPLAAPPVDPDKPLNYLRVDFQTALNGNLHQKVMKFSDQVQTVHAPVRNWEDTVNPDRIELLGPRGVVLKCDELHLSELRGGAGAKWFEVSARGNTNVEGQSFTAQAAQLNYSQDKDLLVLQGTDRSPAELWRQEGPGAPRSHLAARKIEFFRRDNHIKIDRAQNFSAEDIPGDKGRNRPKPAAGPTRPK